ncbi:MAG: potassium channel family protein [Actinobacteria bacterium]|nr:potassium channel family protein [Actinomycetota bacterium]
MGTERVARMGERVEARRGEPDRYGLLLLLIIALLILTAGSETWARVVTVILQGAIVLFALHTARASARTFRVALILVPIAVLLGVVGHVTDSEGTILMAGVILTVLPLVTIITIGGRLATHPEVSIQTVLGFISIYLVIGIFFASLYGTLDIVGDSPFFAQVEDATHVDFLYFSFITMTTVGYGDLTAVESLPRMLAATQALMGQLYLVTVVAVAVSRVTRKQRGEG